MTINQVSYGPFCGAYWRWGVIFGLWWPSTIVFGVGLDPFIVWFEVAGARGDV